MRHHRAEEGVTARVAQLSAVACGCLAIIARDLQLAGKYGFAIVAAFGSVVAFMVSEFCGQNLVDKDAPKAIEAWRYRGEA